VLCEQSGRRDLIAVTQRVGDFLMTLGSHLPLDDREIGAKSPKKHLQQIVECGKATQSACGNQRDVKLGFEVDPLLNALRLPQAIVDFVQIVVDRGVAFHILHNVAEPTNFNHHTRVDQFIDRIVSHGEVETQIAREPLHANATHGQSALRRCFEDAENSEGLGRLADAHPAYAEPFGKLDFGRQAVSSVESPLDDVVADFCSDEFAFLRFAGAFGVGHVRMPYTAGRVPACTKKAAQHFFRQGAVHPRAI